jgi:hypothetical protein
MSWFNSHEPRKWGVFKHLQSEVVTNKRIQEEIREIPGRLYPSVWGFVWGGGGPKKRESLHNVII